MRRGLHYGKSGVRAGGRLELPIVSTVRLPTTLAENVARPPAPARVAAAALAALLLAAASLHAQGTTGKIEGTVRDPAGAPIAGAQVVIPGTAFVTFTNEHGYYFLNNVPAGVLTVRALYVGYAPSEVQGARVFADQTLTVDHLLEPRAVELQEITVTVADNPMFPRDQVVSKSIIRGDLVQALPVGQVSDILRLQPGVVESDRGISIRGGRIGEAIVYVDGVPVRSVSGNTGTNPLFNAIFGQPGIGSIASPTQGMNVVGTNAVEEIDVTTGAIGAAQGDAQSGVISFVTRSGGRRLAGYLSASSDEVSGQVHGQGLNRLEASLGGPLAHNLTFFLATTMEGRQSPLVGIGSQNAPLLVLDGVDTTVTAPLRAGDPASDSVRIPLPSFTRYSSGMRRPDAWTSDWNMDGKITWTYGSGSRLSAALHRTRGQGLTPRSRFLYDSQAQGGYLNRSSALIVNSGAEPHSLPGSRAGAGCIGQFPERPRHRRARGPGVAHQQSCGTRQLRPGRRAVHRR